MILKETIRKVLNEGFKERIIEYLDKFGVMSAVNFFGGWKIIEDTLGEENIPVKLKIRFIKELVKEHDGISLFDLNEDPIFFGQTENQYQEIQYLGLKTVSIQCWDKIEMEDMGEYTIYYEELNDLEIDEIFYMLMEHYRKGLQL